MRYKHKFGDKIKVGSHEGVVVRVYDDYLEVVWNVKSLAKISRVSIVKLERN